MLSLRATLMLRLGLALALVNLTACTPTWVPSEYRQPERFATWVDAAPAAYVIQPGDEIAITLPFNAELNQKALVAPDGTFSMPLAGPLPAAGRSAAQLSGIVDKALLANGVVADARSSVSVVQYGGAVYVDGQVGKPGEIVLRPNMTVMQAIAAAQGMRDTARTDEVVLIRRAPNGRPMLRTIDTKALTRRGDPAQAVVLQSSDMIFVPKSSIAEVNQWVDQYINQALPFNKGINYSYTNTINGNP